MTSAFRSSFTHGQARFGMVVLAVGLSVLGLAAWDNSAGLPWNMPRFWYSQRTTCLWLAVAGVAFGLFVVVRGPREATPAAGRFGWQATRPGRRFRSVTLYTRDGCHLCDEAFELLQSYSAYLPLIQEVDIDADPSLRQQWDTFVPVVEIDGKVRFKGHVSEMLLRRLIEGSPPADSPAASAPMALPMSGMALATGVTESIIPGELLAASAVPLTERCCDEGSPTA